MKDARTIRLEIEERLRRAREAAGNSPWLVGYDVNAIQEYVTANSRPVAMYGASQLIKSFDAEQLRAPGTIFAGGGRGLLMLNHADAKECVETLPGKYAERTVGGVLATAKVPWDESKSGASLRWLRLALENAKDAASRPTDVAPRGKRDQCERCRVFRAVERRHVADEETEFICARCAATTATGRDEHNNRQSLVELSEDGKIAAISADGNNLGELFDSLDTLAATAAVSEAVREVFRHAHAAALARSGDKRHVAPITGGDDIRVFIAPSAVADYVYTLAREVERGAETLGDLDGILRADQRRRFASLGVGVGVVVAGDRTSASWLMERAHKLERSAKSLCRPEKNGGRGRVRSALDFAVLTTDEAFSEGNAAAAREAGDPRPLALDEATWLPFLARVRALREVPSAQRAVLAESRNLGAEEFANLFLYQVARSRKWQAWYESIGVRWSNRDEVLKNRPDGATVEFLRVLGGAR